MLKVVKWENVEVVLTVIKYIIKIIQKKRIRNVGSVKISARKDYLKHKEKRMKYINEYRRKRYKNDPLFRVKQNLSTRMYLAIKNGKKLQKTIDLLGCTLEFLKHYLESKFKPKMSWDNYGSEWHIDHIKPCSSFDLLDLEQQKICFHYTNLQPLWAKDNLCKSNKY